MPVPVTPLLAADIIIELVDRPGRPIVLIERRNPPPGWAIPGGFVDVGESVEQAAVREAQEWPPTVVRRLEIVAGIFASALFRSNSDAAYRSVSGPPLARCRSPSRCRSVDLPEPEGPMIAT